MKLQTDAVQEGFFFSFMSLLKESDGVCSEHGKGIS